MRLGEEVGGGIWNFVPIVRQGVFCAARRRRKSRLIFIFSICILRRDMSGCDMSATLAEGDCHERASGFLSRDHGGLDTCSPIFGLGSSARGVR